MDTVPHFGPSPSQDLVGRLHVLVYGSIDGGICDFYRLGMYRERLLALGVEVRTWGDFNDYVIHVPAAYAGRLGDAIHDGVAEIDRAPIDWADVIVLRRWYPATPACEDCDTVGSPDVVAAHCAATGHSQNAPDLLLPALLGAIEKNPALLRGRGILYETDDDLLSGQPWLPFYRRLQCDRPLVERMLRRADLLTVTTPVLAQRFAPYNDAIRIVRNAVDPSWYEAPAGPEMPGNPRILYYGAAPRLRDYAVCRETVDLVARETPGARRVWLGGTTPAVQAAVDEALPYVEGVPAFAAALVGAQPDIGLAPVVGDNFDRAHSELHWLEYSLAGAATIASRTIRGGPYDAIRDGVDGLLARNRAEWRDGLRRLARSPTLREELAGRARERVLAEYGADDRAREWADAFVWAAEHGGRSSVRRLRALGALPDPPAERTAAESAANLAYRLESRRRAGLELGLLEAARAGRDVCWPEGADDNPLVSVLIPTYNRGRLVVERAIRSVLEGTYANYEIVVVGDGATPETVEAVTSVRDPRVRFENLPARSPRPDDPELAWLVSGSAPYDRALELARGQWIAPLPDDDEFTPDHLELLVSLAIEHRLEFVYGRSLMEAPDGTWFEMGEWPPHHAGFAAGSMVYSAGLRFMPLSTECWREGEPNDWNLWRRMVEAGVRMGFVEQVVFRHYVEARHRLPKAS